MRRWIYLLLILAATMRLGFLLTGDVLPVMWDARRYACAAVGLIALVTDGMPPPVEDERADRYAFKHYYEKYIQGEPIDWQYYAPSTLTQARDDLFFSGPLYPAMLAVVFYLAPLSDFTFARLLGIIFDLLSVLLIVLVAVRLVGRRAAVISGLVYAVYFPFVLTSTMLLLETSTSFFILLDLYLLMRGVETARRWSFVLAGVICGLLVLHKATAMLMGLPLVVGLYFYTRGNWTRSRFLGTLLLIVAPAVLVFAAWLAVTSAKYGQLVLRDPTYAGANLRQSSSIKYEGYDLDTVEPEFWQRPIYGEPLRQWKEYLGLFAKKFERLWGRPYNDFKRTFMLPYLGVEWMHRIVIVLGLLGLIGLAVHGWSQAAWPLAICAYYTAIHLVFHSINRYAFNAMPFLIMGAAFFTVLAFDKLTLPRQGRPGRVVLSLLLVLGGCLIQPGWLTMFLDTGLSFYLVTAVLMVKTMLWLAGTLLLALLFIKRESGARWLRLVVPAGLVFVVMTWTPTLSRDGWAELACRLDDPSVKAGIRIYISNLEKVAEGDALGVFIDLNSPSRRKNSFNVSIGDMQRYYVGGQKPLSDGFYPKPTYIQYAKLESTGIEAFRQYAMIRVDKADIRYLRDSLGYLDISVAINDRIDESNNFITIYGSYITDGDSVFIPTPRYSAVERYVHRGDPRIREAVNYMSDSTISYYIGRNETDVTAGPDLSPSPGRQAGRYNIFLMHFKESGDLRIY